jgi:hypothetical protein
VAEEVLDAIGAMGTDNRAVRSGLPTAGRLRRREKTMTTEDTPNNLATARAQLEDAVNKAVQAKATFDAGRPARKAKVQKLVQGMTPEQRAKAKADFSDLVAKLKTQQASLRK